jgi:hypothetical protein
LRIKWLPSIFCVTCCIQSLASILFIHHLNNCIYLGVVYCISRTIWKVILNIFNSLAWSLSNHTNWLLAYIYRVIYWINIPSLLLDKVVFVR